MKRSYILLLTLLLWQGTLLAQSDSIQFARLQALLRESEGAPYYTGFCAYDLTAGRTIYEYNAHKAMRPASTQKMLTAVAALDILGRNHPYTTQAFASGPVEEILQKSPISSGNFGISDAPNAADSDPNSGANGVATERVRRVLRGNIIVKGDFDPAFTYADVRAIAQQVQNLAIDSIDGWIIGDVSMTDTLSLGYGWCWDDVPSEHIPYLSPLLYNQGKAGRKSSPHPEMRFVQTLRREVEALGIGVRGVRVSTVPATSGATLFCTSQRTIEEILPRMMKNSDNLYAESMFYQLAHSAKASGAGRTEGAKMVEQVIGKAGGNTTDLKVADGSGVSLYNYVTAATQVAMLRYAYARPNIFQPLYESMPIAGVDGTLGGRMKSGKAYSNVHAKTGSVTGVSSLTGYVTGQSGHVIAFSILCNGSLKMSSARSYQDRICEVLAGF